MKLYLARHGDAAGDGDDQERELSALGKAQCSQISLFLGTSGMVVNRILHSGYARTQATAEIYARSVSDALRVDPEPKLGPDNPIEPVLELIAEAEEDTLLVGHYPQLMRLTRHLLESTPIKFGPGSIACFEPDGDQWTIGWFIHPGLLGKAELLVRE